MSDSFADLFHGRLTGIMERDGYDRLGPSLTGRWWVTPFADDNALPYETDAVEVAALLIRLASEVASRKLMSATSPFTYVHTPDDPRMIKLYDPLACGSGCSTASPKPWWVISRMEPTTDELATLRASFAPSPPPFWKKIFS